MNNLAMSDLSKVIPWMMIPSFDHSILWICFEQRNYSTIAAYLNDYYPFQNRRWVKKSVITPKEKSLATRSLLHLKENLGARWKLTKKNFLKNFYWFFRRVLWKTFHFRMMEWSNFVFDIWTINSRHLSTILCTENNLPALHSKNPGAVYENLWKVDFRPKNRAFHSIWYEEKVDSNVFDIANHPHNVYFAIKHFLKSRLFTGESVFRTSEVLYRLPSLIRFRLVLQCYSTLLYTESYWLRRKYIQMQ